jgi:hypothetical protein
MYAHGANYEQNVGGTNEHVTNNGLDFDGT